VTCDHVLVDQRRKFVVVLRMVLLPLGVSSSVVREA